MRQSGMRLMIAVFVLVFLLIVDQSRYHGHYTAQFYGLVRYGLDLVR